MLKAIIIAFSTYSKLPMPHIEWSDKGMQYSLCFFPMVGGVIGLCSLGLYVILGELSMGRAIIAVTLCAIPVLVTGGIHVDGFLDTVDARSSYQAREQRLQILKDPHIGAFALLYGIFYFLLSFALFQEITGRGLIVMAVGYCYSRILSAFSVVTLQKAKREGMVATYAKQANKQVKWILVIEGLACIGVMCAFHMVLGSVCALVGLACFLYYMHMAYQTFGGITGDLAGWFLQVCELMMLLVTVLLGKLG